MDANTKAKIDALLRELRTWDRGEVRATPWKLAGLFGLDPFIVKRIMQSESIPIETDSGVHNVVGFDEADTQPVPREILD
jgi:hypothetical protein